MQSTNRSEDQAVASASVTASTSATPSQRAKTESVFAADDTAGVDAFHANTLWGKTLEPAQSKRIHAFLNNPILRELVSGSRHEYQDLESILLPEAGLGTITLEEALLQRRSLSSNAPPRAVAIDVEDLAAILKYSYGVVKEQRAGAGGPVRRLRTCPSAGALYPLEIYPVVMDVAGVAPGVYHYNAVEHSLSCLRREDAAALMPAFDFQPGFRALASVVFIVTAVLLRTMAKYLDRGYRFVMNEAGALTQNMHLTAQARGLPACILGGFCDAELASYVGVDGAKEIVVLGFILGKHAKPDDEYPHDGKKEQT